MMKGQLHEMHARVIHLLKYMEEENCLGQKKVAAVAGDDDCRRTMGTIFFYDRGAINCATV